MPKVIKPASIRLPDRYSLLVLPNTTVRVGTQIDFELTYQTGKAEDHQPSLELLRDPDTHPETPRHLGSMHSMGSIASLGFTVNKLGTYAFKVKPFLSTDFGELVEIHTISSEEVDSLKCIVDKFAKSR
jgi:hypothetical protein